MERQKKLESRARPGLEMKESVLVKKIMDAIRSHGWQCMKTHGGRFSSGQPDIIGCAAGRFFALEVKVPGREGTLTKLQAASLASWKSAGGVSEVVTSVDQAITFITISN